MRWPDRRLPLGDRSRAAVAAARRRSRRMPSGQTPPDTFDPVVWFASPYDDETVSGTVTVDVEAYDASGIGGVDLRGRRRGRRRRGYVRHRGASRGTPTRAARARTSSPSSCATTPATPSVRTSCRSSSAPTCRRHRRHLPSTTTRWRSVIRSRPWDACRSPSPRRRCSPTTAIPTSRPSPSRAWRRRPPEAARLRISAAAPIATRRRRPSPASTRSAIRSPTSSAARPRPTSA